MWSHIWLHIIAHEYWTKLVFEFCSIFRGILCCMCPPFNERGRVLPSVGGCAWMWEGASQCERVCPCICDMCACEMWVSLSHVLMTNASVCSSDCSLFQSRGKGLCDRNILKSVAIDLLILLRMHVYATLLYFVWSVYAHQDQFASCHNTAMRFSTISDI